MFLLNLPPQKLALKLVHQLYEEPSGPPREDMEIPITSQCRW